MAEPLRILVVATKLPWPPRDGGRLLLATTLEGLAERGHRLTLVAPDLGRRGSGWVPPEPNLESVHAVPASLPSRPGALLRSLVTGVPMSLLRHRHRTVLAKVTELLAGEPPFDLVHVEQLQALVNVPETLAGGRSLPPLVLRAQNVESDLWRSLAEQASAGVGRLYRHQARRLERAEAAALARADLTLALSAEDTARLSALAAETSGARRSEAPRIETLPAPFAPHDPASQEGASLEGDPPLVILGSAGWLPNRDGLDWFLGEIWPGAREAFPGARLHVFGMAASPHTPAGVIPRPPPAEAAEAFPPGSLLVVPLRIASGVRMKILEAWARGIPVLASETAARGLQATPGRDLEVFTDEVSFRKALRRRASPGARADLARAGRETLHRHHDPESVLNRQLAAYRSLRR